MTVFVVMSKHGDRESVMSIVKTKVSAWKIIGEEMDKWRKDPGVKIVGENWGSEYPSYTVWYHEINKAHSDLPDYWEYYTEEIELED